MSPPFFRIVYKAQGFSTLGIVPTQRRVLQGLQIECETPYLRLHAATLHEPDDDNNHHDDQHNVNQAAKMKNGESEEPQDEQDNGNSPKHSCDCTFRTVT
jgi:hypothetical protein